MKIALYIEKHFWIFLLSGLLAGLIFPVFNDFLMSVLKPFLMTMLFLVFLKTDIALIFTKMKNYKMMAFIVVMNMIIFPLFFYLTFNIFNPALAIGMLLLTSMPAGVTTPALADIVKGNTALSASIVIVTSVVAPLTVPMLFLAINNKVSVDPWLLFKDLALIVFVPMVLSQILKRYMPGRIERKNHLFTAANIIILSVMVYAIMGSQREIILGDFRKIIWEIVWLFVVYILLHIFGYLTAFKEDKEGKIAVTIGSAYINNGMAIVLAAVYFEPSVLILMVLSELPWNTLLIPFKKSLKYF
ncbi:MAG: bile acid:sodium symporter [Prolixibacteraceae bacterium]|nr:bile acid:sodium symporter [Prolixibacteraceae bacterium]